MTETVLGSSLQFLHELGIFEIVLPFLFVFTLMFALLEKTKVLGVEKYRGEDGKIYDVTRKNLNSMLAFVVAFFVVASAQLVALITEISSHIVVFIVLFFLFALTAGSFRKQSDEGFELNKFWLWTFEIAAFIVLVVLFLNAMGWLSVVMAFLSSAYSNEMVATLLLLAIMVGFIFFITYEKKPGGSEQKSS